MRLRLMHSILLTAAMIAGLLFITAAPVCAADEPAGLWTDTAEEPTETDLDYDEGTGITTYTYTVNNASELAWFATENRYRFGNIKYVIELGQDIDMSGHFWVPIGNESWSFKGTFDGNGKKISNLTIGTSVKPEEAQRNMGLFGYVEDSVIRNVNLANLSIYSSADLETVQSGAPQIGGIAGDIRNCTISGCSVEGSIEVIIAGNNLLSTCPGVGGLVGFCHASTIENSHAACTITSDGSETPAGGLVGYISYSGTTSSVTNCYASGNVSGSGARYAGGLIGIGGGTLTDCYAIGNVTTTAQSSDVGGLIGHSYCELRNCFAIGNATGGDVVGGLVGFARSGVIINCFARGNVISSRGAGGLIGMSVANGAASVDNCYASGDINTQTIGVNFSAGGLIGNKSDVTSVEYGYWNGSAAQIYTQNGTGNPLDPKAGIGQGTDTTSKKSENEMTDTRFTQLLNDNRGVLREWSSVSGVNDGYPYLEGLYFETPADTVTVTFISNGDDYRIIDVVPGDTIGTPDDPVRVHWNFSGWYTTSDLDVEFDFETPVTSGACIYAKWEQIPTYTAAYDLNEGTGTVPDSEVYESGDIVTLALNTGFTREGYVFKGWTTASDGSGTVYAAGSTYTMGSDNVTFYAKWNPTYTITYDANGGSGEVPVNPNRYEANRQYMVDYGYGIERDGFYFRGWALSSTGDGTLYLPGSYHQIGTSNIIFYAKWEAKPVYTVTYDKNGDDVTGTVPDAAQYEEGDEATVASGEGLAKEGYFFGGWVSEFGDVYYPGENYVVYGDSTFYARWTNNWIDMVDLDEHEPYYDEDTDEIIIENALELACVAYIVNIEGFDFTGCTIKLVNDIDLSGHDWVPIGNDNTDFRGIFDGNNKAISNLKIGSEGSPNDELQYAGLFGRIYYAYIRNVCLTDVGIYSSYEDEGPKVGGLAGYASLSSIIGCGSTGTVQNVNECADLGGLVGKVEDCQLYDNYAVVNVKGGECAAVGGLVGIADSADYYEASNNYAAGNVEASEESEVGGFAGRMFGGDEAVSYCYWSSDAEQIISGIEADPKKGIGFDPDDELESLLVSKTSAEMRNSEFALLLDAHKHDNEKVWLIVSGINNGYPVFVLHLGTVTGIVSDGTEPIPGANVDVVSGEHAYSAVTDANGLFIIADVNIGTGCTVTASADGYMSASQSNVNAAYGQNATVNFTLDIDPSTVEYHISIGAVTGGSITVPSATAVAGEMIDVIVIPDDGKILKEGSLKYNDGTDHSISGSTFIMPASDIVVTAEFEDIDPVPVEYYISIGTITGGTITVPSTTAAAGEMIFVTVIPDSGKILKEGSLKYNDGTDYSISGNTFIMPASDVVVTAVFEDIDPGAVKYHISIGTIEGGTITVPSTTAAAGEIIIVTATPDSGKILKEGSLKYNDGTDHIISGNTFIMPASDVVVTAEFEDVPQITWTVVFDKNGGDTEANPASKTVVSGESSSTLPTAPARAGYTFKGWNTAVDGSGTVFTASTMVNSNITVYAQWKRNTSGSDNGNGGDGSGDYGSTIPTADIPAVKTTVTTSANVSTATTIVTVSTYSSGKAQASVAQEQISDAAAKAADEARKQGDSVKTRVELVVDAPTDAKTVELSISKQALSLAAEAETDEFKVSTPVASITFDAETLSNISQEAGDDITIAASRVEASSLSEDARKVVGDRPVFNFSVTSGDRNISQFGGDVEVSVPYTPKEDEDTDAIIICYINAQGQAEIVSNCSYDPETGTVTFRTNHFSQYAVGYNKMTFKDVTADAWYGKAVGYIAARGITTGKGNGNYDPAAKLTRGEFIVMLMRAYGIAPDADSTDNFKDAGSTYYTGYLASAKRLGISKGVGNSMFAPAKAITRQEMFTLLYNTLKVIDELPEESGGKSLVSFSDADQIEGWAAEAMKQFAETGIVSGSAGKLYPSDTTTRAEMAQVLYNLLNK